MADLQGLAQAIINGKAPDAKAMTEAALAEGINPGQQEEGDNPLLSLYPKKRE